MIDRLMISENLKKSHKGGATYSRTISPKDHVERNPRDFTFSSIAISRDPSIENEDEEDSRSENARNPCGSRGEKVSCSRHDTKEPRRTNNRALPPKYEHCTL